MKKTIIYKNDDDSKCYYEQALTEITRQVSLREYITGTFRYWVVEDLHMKLKDKRFKQRKLILTQLLLLNKVSREEIEGMNRAQMMTYLYLFAGHTK